MRVEEAGHGGRAHSQGHKSAWIEAPGKPGLTFIRLRMVPVIYRTYNGNISSKYEKQLVRWNINFGDLTTELSAISDVPAMNENSYARISQWIGYVSEYVREGIYPTPNAINNFSNKTLTGGIMVFGAIKRIAYDYSLCGDDKYTKETANLNTSITYTGNAETGSVTVSTSSPTAGILKSISTFQNPNTFVTKVTIKPQVKLTCSCGAGAKITTGAYGTITNQYPDSSYDAA